MILHKTSLLFKFYNIAERFYVDDGCQSDTASGDNVVGSYQPKSFKAHVRCCSSEGDKCYTLGNCRDADNAVNYDAARKKCESSGYRLCTKDEILNDVCCKGGGDCDFYTVWTSTSIKGKENVKDKENLVFRFSKPQK